MTRPTQPIAFVLVMTFVGLVAGQPKESPPAKAKEVQFVAKALLRLDLAEDPGESIKIAGITKAGDLKELTLKNSKQVKVTAEQMKELDKKYSTLLTKNRGEDVVLVAEVIYSVSKNNKATNSTVTIKTEKAGATVKYQTIWDRTQGAAPTTAKQPTECQQTMPIGIYYIWAERNGKATSDKDSQFTIVDANEGVTLVE